MEYIISMLNTHRFWILPGMLAAVLCCMAFQAKAILMRSHAAWKDTPKPLRSSGASKGSTAAREEVGQNICKTLIWEHVTANEEKAQDARIQEPAKSYGQDQESTKEAVCALFQT